MQGAPAQHKEGEFRLGTWIGTQRENKDAISAGRRQRLDELGFVWDPFAADWEEGVAALASFKQREGHCRVPQGYKEGEFGLGNWIGTQRKNKDALSAGRRQRLDELGFVWVARLTPTN